MQIAPQLALLKRVVLGLLYVSFSLRGEPVKMTMIEDMVPGLPAGDGLKGPFPSPLMLVKLQERGETFDEPVMTSFRVFDPSQPEKGLREIFKGPGRDQAVWKISPLYGGWAVVEARLNQNGEAPENSETLWWNFLTAESGAEVPLAIYGDRIEGDWVIGTRGNEDGEGAERFVRYHPARGIVETLPMDFSYFKWLGQWRYLGITKLSQGERVVLLDVGKTEYRDLGSAPPWGEQARSIYRSELGLAGKEGVDGVYAFTGFSLWFLPKGGTWAKVIDDVHVVKTFGGVAPWLPVAYVGRGRFAVSKTTKDRVKVPKDWPEDRAIFGAAEAVTMLVDGKTGKVLKESKPFVYDHNPPLEIPRDWWLDGNGPRPNPWDEIMLRDSPSSFVWKEESRTLVPTKGKAVRVGAEEIHRVSDNGRFAAIYDRCPTRGEKNETLLKIRVVDGKSGEVRVFQFESKHPQIWTEVHWFEMRAPPKVD